MVITYLQLSNVKVSLEIRINGIPKQEKNVCETELGKWAVLSVHLEKSHIFRRTVEQSYVETDWNPF